MARIECFEKNIAGRYNLACRIRIEGKVTFKLRPEGWVSLARGGERTGQQRKQHGRRPWEGRS